MFIHERYTAADSHMYPLCVNSTEDCSTGNWSTSISYIQGQNSLSLEPLAGLQKWLETISRPHLFA